MKKLLLFGLLSLFLFGCGNHKPHLSEYGKYKVGQDILVPLVNGSYRSVEIHDIMIQDDIIYINIFDLKGCQYIWIPIEPVNNKK